MYNVLKNINNTTMLVEQDNLVYIAKVIAIDDVDMYKRLMNINNPNIVHFFGTEVVDDKLCVIEEYVQGITLEEYYNRYKSTLDDQKIVDIIKQVCNGLEAVHNYGLVHRDINPSNIMIAGNGVVKIIDFGISRISKSNQQTDTQILGTQGYAAPEQYGFSQTNAKSDIYSIGVLINYLKTGYIPSVVHADGWLGDIVSKCTQIDEARRYSNISDLLVALSKRGHVMQLFSIIPGFRQKKWWHIIVATLYYAFFVLIMYAMIDMADGIKQAVCYTMVGIFGLALPVPILTSFLDWTNRLSMIKNSSRSTKAVLQVMLVIICLIISTVFIILSPSV